jgi:hypothetical protein
MDQKIKPKEVQEEDGPYDGYYYLFGGLYMAAAALLALFVFVASCWKVIEIFPNQSICVDLTQYATAQFGYIYVPSGSGVQLQLSDSPASVDTDTHEVSRMQFKYYEGNYAWESTDLDFLAADVSVLVKIVDGKPRQPLLAKLTGMPPVQDLTLDITDGFGMFQINQESDYMLEVFVKDRLKHKLKLNVTVSLQRPVFVPQGNFHECSGFCAFSRSDRFAVLRNTNDDFFRAQVITVVPSFVKLVVLLAGFVASYLLFKFGLRIWNKWPLSSRAI